MIFLLSFWKAFFLDDFFGMNLFWERDELTRAKTDMSSKMGPFQKKRIVFQSFFSGEVSFRACNHLIIGIQEDIFLEGFFVDELFGDEGPLEGISSRKEIS